MARVLREGVTVAIGAAMVLCAWVAIVAALTFTVPADASVAVIGPTNSSIAAVAAAGGRIVQAGNYLVVARFDEPGFVPRLYTAGALLVVDARATSGCTGLPRAAQAALRF